jgi:chromate reductase
MARILFVPGSLRAASASRATVRALVARMAGKAETAVAEIGTLPHYDADLTDVAEVAEFVGAIRAADLVVFVTPEYNYSVPGVLKNAIDWASRPAFASVFKDKPCLVISVSGGALGGVRAQGHLKYILNGMLAEVIPAREIVVPMANTKVADGLLTDTAILDFAEETLTAALARLG